MHSTQPIHFFISYSHKDQILADELLAHLYPLTRHSNISIWHDKLLPVGSDWKKETRRQIEQAQVIITLISPDYLASERSHDEIEQALTRQKDGQAQIVPIMIRPSMLDGTSLENLHILFREQAVVQRINHDEAWTEAVQSLKKIAAELERIRTKMESSDKATSGSDGGNGRGGGGGGGGDGGGGGGKKGNGPEGAVRDFSSREYAQLGLILFGITSLLLAGFVAAAHWFPTDGIQDRVYLFSLVGLGLVVALITFGTMRSYAHYKGRQLNGALEVGGPFLSVIIIVSIGLFVSPNEPFSMTVRVNRNGKRIKKGIITVDIGPDRREKPLDSSGEANFKEIPKNMWLKKARFEFDGEECNNLLGSNEYEIQKVVTLLCEDSAPQPRQKPSEESNPTHLPQDTEADLHTDPCPDGLVTQKAANKQNFIQIAAAEGIPVPTVVGGAFKQKATNESPSFFLIETAKKISADVGGTHGQFYYTVDADKMNIPGKYILKFCAWSLESNELGLHIRNGTGFGVESALSKTIKLTRDRKQFNWTVNFDGTDRRIPQILIIGYLVDLKSNIHPCNSDLCAGKKFVIGNMRLETDP